MAVYRTKDIVQQNLPVKLQLSNSEQSLKFTQPCRIYNTDADLFVLFFWEHQFPLN